jgi:hypothetical protein
MNLLILHRALVEKIGGIRRQRGKGGNEIHVLEYERLWEACKKTTQGANKGRRFGWCGYSGDHQRIFHSGSINWTGRGLPVHMGVEKCQGALGGILMGVKEDIYEVEDSEIGEYYVSMALRNRVSKSLSHCSWYWWGMQKQTEKLLLWKAVVSWRGLQGEVM